MSCTRKPRCSRSGFRSLIESFRGELSFRADAEHPGFTYRKKRKSGAEKNADSLEIVKKVLIGIKGLIDH